MLRKGRFSRSAWTALAVGGVLTGLFVAGLGSAQDDPAVRFAGPPTFADVIEQVSPAVVNITVTKQPVQLSSNQVPVPDGAAPFEDFFRQFGFGGPNWPQPAPMRGEGSGFIIDADGYIATNNHVVDSASEVTVTLDSGEQLTARVVGTDPRTDLALLKVDNGGDLPSLELGDSDSARVGDWVLAIGNPFGLGGSATAGIISARGRDIQSGPYDDFLQIDAPINSGNSGGPVFNAAGEVIGINTAIFSPNGGNIGIGFAIPSNQAESILADLREEGQVNRGWFGVSIGPVDAPGDFYVPEDVTSGALIASIVENGPAALAGFQSGDIVTAVDGQAIDSPRELTRLIGDMDAGDEVEIEFLRNGERMEASAVLGLFPTNEAELRAAAPTRQQPPQQAPYRYYRYEYPGERFFRR